MIALPELIVTLTALCAFVSDLFVKEDRPRAVPIVVMVGLTLACMSFFIVPHSGYLFGGRFVVDLGVLWFKGIFCLATLFAVMLSWDSFYPRSYEGKKLTHSGEFCTLLLLTLLGMMILVSSRDLVTIYVSLELSTIPLFLLSSWSRTSISSEGGLKYVVLGAISSALILFGMSILYGLTGEMTISGIMGAENFTPGYWYALSLIGAGVGFKLAVVPFQMWAPDVYEGAPTPITAYLSVASKTTGVALAVFLFSTLAGEHLASWGGIIAMLSAFTMTMGNVAAIAQNNIKRFMAYSSISQAGYILMGFIGAAPEGLSVIVFYMLGYLVTNIAAFSVIILYANETGREELRDYAGLSLTRPLLALVLMISLFSLAGIPPLAGFTGKFFLFSIAAKSGFYWLVTLAAVNSTISLYYYLKIVRQMYIEVPLVIPSTFSVSRVFAIVMCVTVAGTIAIGVFPGFYETIHSQLTVAEG